MSPEQVEGRKLDVRSDIFSFGAVLNEMITGQRAFDGPSRPAIPSKIRRDAHRGRRCGNKILRRKVTSRIRPALKSRISELRHVKKFHDVAKVL